MPEGDSLQRAALSLQVLVGQRVAVETPHPRAAGKRLVERLDGLVLEGVEALGKRLLLRFEGGIVLRSHLRMSGRWRVEPLGATRTGRPCGDAAFVRELEEKLARPLAPQKRGPKPREVQDEAFHGLFNGL